ncbi:MAG: transcriptional regulator, PadR family [Candidatus Solibacter sp.]|nr:transcriptional regulator, PadR family [Candidatus Solibacter sp.]
MFAQPEKFPLLTEGSPRILISDTDMSKPNDLVQGTLDLLLLKILALEPLHGWAITLRLKSVSGDVLQVSEGSLYPALHKLEQEGWITAEWKQTENNRRAKFYSLTRLGKRHLVSEVANWERLSSAISRVIQTSEV